jgi:hypothetical protein
VAERYFSATVLGGRLYIQGVSDYGPWNPRIAFYPEEVADTLTSIYPTDRKIHSEEELREAVRASETEFGARTVRAPESLLDVTRKVWEESRQQRDPRDLDRS